MGTGRKAFEGESVPALLAAIVRDEPKPLGEVVPTAPIELQTLVSRTLRKDRERRFQSMADLRVALQDVQAEIDSGRVPSVQGKSIHRVMKIAAALVVVGAAAAAVTL